MLFVQAGDHFDPFCLLSSLCSPGLGWQGESPVPQQFLPSTNLLSFFFSPAATHSSCPFFSPQQPLAGESDQQFHGHSAFSAGFFCSHVACVRNLIVLALTASFGWQELIQCFTVMFLGPETICRSVFHS